MYSILLLAEFTYSIRCASQAMIASATRHAQQHGAKHVYVEAKLKPLVKATVSKRRKSRQRSTNPPSRLSSEILTRAQTGQSATALALPPPEYAIAAKTALGRPAAAPAELRPHENPAFVPDSPECTFFPSDNKDRSPLRVRDGRMVGICQPHCHFVLCLPALERSCTFLRATKTTPASLHSIPQLPGPGRSECCHRTRSRSCLFPSQKVRTHMSVMSRAYLEGRSCRR